MPLNNKSNVFNAFIEFRALVLTQYNKHVKSLHSDWGGKYHKLHNWFKSIGIVHRITTPYTP